MKKLVKILTAMSMVCVLGACSSSDSSSAEGSDTLTGTYSIYVEGDDWGCGVSKATVSLDYVVDEVSADDFVVTEHKQTTDWADETYPIIEADFDREVTNAYLVDEDGNETTDASSTVVLELYISPNDGSPLLYTVPTGYNSWSDPYYLTIALSDDAALTSAGTEVTSFEVDTEYTEKTTSADGFSTDTFEASDGTNYGYAYYEAEDSDTLFVWIHGMGEGGADVNPDTTDPYVNTLANKVPALISDEFQDAVGGASVLVPQCPTYWMDETGDSANYNAAGIELTSSTGSYYLDSLTELIEDYTEKVGAEKVVIGGDSNGGYMTVELAIAHPEMFTAIIPICEAMPNDLISDDDIANLASMPSYFIFSAADTTVVPELHELPTIERLKDAGADVHVFNPDTVIDTSGRFDDEDGNPYEYNGHWSWIYFDNNEADCDECGTSVWDWIGEQVK